MKICVLMKQVASEDSPLKINNNGSGIDETNLNLITNEPDSYALEEALLIKEKNFRRSNYLYFRPRFISTSDKRWFSKGR